MELKLIELTAKNEVCKTYDTPLLVDNAHGAYLAFLEENRHPIALGATMCCDSAHKTLPVLTGGAYLHISKDAPESFVRSARSMLALFASTSPSYLILASLDRCNASLADGYEKKLAKDWRIIAESLENKGIPRFSFRIESTSAPRTKWDKKWDKGWE